MPTSLPYLPSYNKLDTLFSKIAAAKQPEVFTQQYLSQTLGLASSSDRALIPFLRNLGFLDSSNHPTPSYSELKNPAKARTAIAAAIRNAYAPLFTANENAHKLGSEELKGLISQVAGTDEGLTSKTSGTLRALIKLGDFDSVLAAPESEESNESEDVATAGDETRQPDRRRGGAAAGTRGPLNPEFHYNIQVHLPSNATEETYLSIFNALRRAFA